MSVEDLLNLDGNQIELVTDSVVLPGGFYHFTVADSGIGEVGKEKKPAIEVTVEFTGVEALDNLADQALVDTLDLGNNPVKYKENFLLNSKDGFGLRSFCTFTAQWAEATNNPVVSDRVNNLAGAKGIIRVVTNTYLPENKPDSPENYRTNNRLRVQEVVWS